MKILMSSYAFPPSVGGLEEVSDILAHQFVELGHEVRVLTMTPSAAPDRYPFEIVRRPSPLQLARSIRWCDVYLQQNISFRLGWPLLIFRRPWVVAMHGTLFGDDGLIALKKFLKRLILRFARVTSCSAAMARGLRQKVTVIGNPYRSDLFRILPSSVVKPYDLAFLGRLVSDKGADRFVGALARLRRSGITPRALIIGGGPEESKLRAHVAAEKLSTQVTFTGIRRGERLVASLNQCRILVVPSLVEEGFGVVALEGIACGCIVIASAAGGLPEAVGPCGVTFPSGDVAALAERIEKLLGDEHEIAQLRARADAHLRRHAPRAVAEAYLSVLADACVPRLCP